MSEVIDLGEVRRQRVAEAREPWITKAQAGAHLAVGIRTIERWQNEHGLPFRRVGNRNRYRRSELDRWLERQDIAARAAE